MSPGALLENGRMLKEELEEQLVTEQYRDAILRKRLTPMLMASASTYSLGYCATCNKYSEPHAHYMA
jgi:hypothetical protein